MQALLTSLRAAAEATRLRVLALLSKGELSVTDLTTILGQSQPRVSRHLKLLCDAGLLSRYREGAWVLYRLAESGPGASLSRLIISQIPEIDATILRDGEHLDMLRAKRTEAARVYFETNAPAWDEIRALHVADLQVEKALLEALGPKPIGMLLDLGTGTGRLLELLAGQIEQGIGIDNAPAMLAYARDRLEAVGLGNIQVRQGDIYNLPYDNELADVVTIHQVLHFLDNPQAALMEAARMLKPGGRMIIVDFDTHDLELLRDQYAHRRLGISQNQMKKWLEVCGLNLNFHTSLKPQKKRKDGLTVMLWLASKTRIASPNGARQSELEQV